MKLLLNGRELDDVVSEGTTLGGALSVVQSKKIPDSLVISEIWVDGSPLTAELLSEWKHRPADEFGETRVETLPRKQMAANGLRIIRQGLLESYELRETIVKHLCQGRADQAMKFLAEYLNLWNNTQQSVASACRMLDIPIDVTTPDDLTPNLKVCYEQIKSLTEQLQQLKNALEVGDLVLLGDILSYEFGDITDRWQNMLQSLADHIESL